MASVTLDPHSLVFCAYACHGCGKEWTSLPHEDLAAVCEGCGAVDVVPHGQCGVEGLDDVGFSIDGSNDLVIADLGSDGEHFVADDPSEES